jgi:hypothetical protein
MDTSNMKWVCNIPDPTKFPLSADHLTLLQSRVLGPPQELFGGVPEGRSVVGVYDPPRVGHREWKWFEHFGVYSEFPKAEGWHLMAFGRQIVIAKSATRPLADDRDAVAFVAKKAVGGSVKHMLALFLHGQGYEHLPWVPESLLAPFDQEEEPAHARP